MTRRMQTDGVAPHIDRLYRTSATKGIAAREVAVNEAEHGGRNLTFAVEPQSQRQGLFRRWIHGDGDGMAPATLEHGFSRFGGSSKAVGGDHDNFGVGAKTMLAPWNRNGVVVVTRTRDMDEPICCWLWYDPAIGDYGLKEFEVLDDDGTGVLEPVVTAHYNDELGIDLRQLLPHRTGTALLLLGTDDHPHTVHGSPLVGETHGNSTVRLLAQRFWEHDPLGMQIVVESLTGEPDTWGPYTPVRRDVVHGLGWNAERVPDGMPAPQQARVELSDGTVAHLVLRDASTGTSSSQTGAGASERGCIAVGYVRPDGRGTELFELDHNQQRYAAMGVRYQAVAARLYVVFYPPLADRDAGRTGVLMDSGRTSLRWVSGDGETGPLPLASWRAELAARLPACVVAALDAERATSDVTLDGEELRRLSAEFQSRWKTRRPAADRDGSDSYDPAATGRAEPSGGTGGGGAGGAGGSQTGRGGVGGSDGGPRGGSGGGPKPARSVRGSGGLPQPELVRQLQFSGDAHQLACYIPPSSSAPAGVVQLNVDHPVVKGEVTHYASLYPAHLHSDVEQVVQTVYVTAAVAAVAHVEALRGPLRLPSDTVDRWRDPDALTAALLGLWGLAPRIDRALRSLGVGRLTG